MKYSQLTTGLMEINPQTSQNVNHRILYGPKLGIAWGSTRVQSGRSPVLFTVRNLIKDDRPRANIPELGKPYIWRLCLIVLTLPTVVCLQLWLIIPPQNTRWHGSSNQHLRVWNRMASIEEPHTMHGAHHTAGFRCINQQSWCKGPHQVLGSPWAQSAISRKWKHSHWEELKASKRGQR